MASPVSDNTPASSGTPASQSPSRAIFEWVTIIAVAIAVTLVVRAFVFEAYYIPSASMETTLNIGDRVLVDKLSYDLHSVHRGDIIVFARPPTETDLSIHDLIKRVIGLPGDTIQSGPNGEIFIDGKPLAQPWLTPSAKNNPGPEVPKQVIARNEYYVMGDNRGYSQDSRYIGPISGNLIVGKAVFRVWPLSRVTVF